MFFFIGDLSITLQLVENSYFHHRMYGDIEDATIGEGTVENIEFADRGIGIIPYRILIFKLA